LIDSRNQGLRQFDKPFTGQIPLSLTHYHCKEFSKTAAAITSKYAAHAISVYICNFVQCEECNIKDEYSYYHNYNIEFAVIVKESQTGIF
jgi:hypothetical protein